VQVHQQNDGDNHNGRSYADDSVGADYCSEEMYFESLKLVHHISSVLLGSEDPSRCRHWGSVGTLCQGYSALKKYPERLKGLKQDAGSSALLQKNR
jgi:hypothetical protein